MPEEKPNSPAPQDGGNEPKPVMGTTPTGQQPAPTPTEKKPEGTDGEEKKPTTTPNEGEGNEPKATIDYEKKFSASSAEAQRLHAILKQAGIDPETGKPIEAQQESEKPSEEQIQASDDTQYRQEQSDADIKPFTDEELQRNIPGFANMEPGLKSLYKDLTGTMKLVKKMAEFYEELNDERQFGKDIKALTAKEEWKKISEFSDEFREYAYSKENVKTPLETLASSFLYKKGVVEKKPDEKPIRKGVESGGSGKGEERGTRDEGYTDEEAGQLRKSDPKKYQRLIREGKLKVRE